MKGVFFMVLQVIENDIYNIQQRLVYLKIVSRLWKTNQHIVSAVIATIASEEIVPFVVEAEISVESL